MKEFVRNTQMGRITRVSNGDSLRHGIRELLDGHVENVQRVPEEIIGCEHHVHVRRGAVEILDTSERIDRFSRRVLYSQNRQD